MPRGLRSWLKSQQNSWQHCQRTCRGNRLYETLKGSQYFVADSATKRARTLKISEGSLHAITVKLHVADSRNPLQGKSDPSKRHKFPMRATSYCGRGTGEKEINRYGQKERTQEKGPKDPLIGTPFEFPTDTVSCQGSLRQLIYNLQNPGTLYLSLRL